MQLPEGIISHPSTPDCLSAKGTPVQPKGFITHPDVPRSVIAYKVTSKGYLDLSMEGNTLRADSDMVLKQICQFFLTIQATDNALRQEGYNPIKDWDTARAHTTKARCSIKPHAGTPPQQPDFVFLYKETLPNAIEWPWQRHPTLLRQLTRPSEQLSQLGVAPQIPDVYTPTAVVNFMLQQKLCLETTLEFLRLDQTPPLTITTGDGFNGRQTDLTLSRGPNSHSLTFPMETSWDILVNDSNTSGDNLLFNAGLTEQQKRLFIPADQARIFLHALGSALKPLVKAITADLPNHPNATATLAENILLYGTEPPKIALPEDPEPMSHDVELV